MTVIEKAQGLLLEMTRQEKFQLLQLVTYDLSEEGKGIESTVGICGGSPRIAGTRIPVWAIIQYQKLGASDIELLQAYPTIGAEDIANVKRYYQTHQNEIEQQIRENELG